MTCFQISITFFVVFKTTLHKRRRKGCISQWATKRSQPTNQLNRVHKSTEKLNQQTWALYGSYLSPLHILYGCVAWWSSRTPINGSVCRGSVSDFLPMLASLFLLLDCFVQLWYESLYPGLFYLVRPCSVNSPGGGRGLLFHF